MMTPTRLCTLLVFAIFGLSYLLDVGYCEDVQAPVLWQAAYLESEEVDPNEAKPSDLVRDFSALPVPLSLATAADPWKRLLFSRRTGALQWATCIVLPPRGPPSGLVVLRF